MKEYSGFSIRQALPTGGKAGKGRNKTTSIRVTMKAFPHKSKVFQYSIHDIMGRPEAIRKAVKWIEDQEKGWETTVNILPLMIDADTKPDLLRGFNP